MIEEAAALRRTMLSPDVDQESTTTISIRSSQRLADIAERARERAILRQEREAASIHPPLPISERCYSYHRGLGCAASEANHSPKPYSCLDPVLFENN
jgi:hypothetical protein